MSNTSPQTMADNEMARRNAFQLEAGFELDGETVISFQGSRSHHGETRGKGEKAGDVLATTEKTSQKQIGSMVVYKRIVQSMSMTDRILYLCGIICSMGSGTVFPLMTLIFGSFVTVFTDFAAGRVDSSVFREKIDHYTLYFVYLFIAKFGLSYISMTLFSIVSNRVTATLRRSYLRAVLHKDITFHERDSSSGAVSLALSSHCNTIQSGLSDKFGLSLQCASTVVAAFVVAFSTQWKLTLVTATVAPATVICVGVTAIFDSKFEDAISTTNSEAATLAEEIISSIRTVYALRATEKLLVKYKSYLDHATAVGWKRTPIVGLQTGIYMFMIYAAYALAFWYGVQLFVKAEAKSSGAVITTLFAIVLGTNAFSQLAAYLAPFLKISSAGEKVFQVIGNLPIPDQTHTRYDQLTPVDSLSQQPTQQISLSNVYFSYPLRPNVPVLSDLSLDFVPGSMTALVGPSGSGKSTIVGLLERWYDVTDGKVELDGYNIKNIPVKALRENIGLVTQEPFLFSTTVKENILYGLSDRQMASLSEAEKFKLVVEACKLANAHDFVQKLPNAYDTFVGNRATLLSGGQKQRLAIARAIIGNPSVLILDEATSALDPESERIVQHALDKASEGRTTIVIAHRLSTIRHASKIVVLAQGKIVEEGSHEELVLKADGVYKRLLSAQSLLHDESSGLTSENTASKVPTKASSDAETFIDCQNALDAANEGPGQRQQGNLGLGKTMFAILLDQRRYWVAYTALFACCVIGGALYPLQAFLYAKIVSAFQLPISELLSRGNFWALMFLVLSICAGLAYFVIAAAGSGLGEAITQFYRYSYITGMTNQPVAFFDAAENSSGSLISRLATDPDAIRSLGGPNLGVMTVVGVSIISTMIFSLEVGWKLALVAICGAFPFVFGAGLVRETMEHKFEETTAKTFAESVGFASECIQAIKTVSSLNMETRVDASFGSLLDGNCARARHYAIRSMVWFAFSESLDMLCMGLTFWYGGTLLATREYNTTQFFIVFVAIVLSAQSSGQFFAHSLDLSKGHVASNSIRTLKQSIVQDNEIKREFPSPTEDQEKCPLIEFQDVNFTYPTRPTNLVLSGLNLSVKKGQFVAIVGPSGCGKSTICSLLERFYNIDNGRIRFNGTDIQNLHTNEIRKQFALVSQEPTLFQGTIRENILLSTPPTITTNSTNSSTTETAFLDAITKAAQIHDLVISLPSGYETQVGSRGTALSGGQKQRLAIARAMAQTDAEVLLLDEATSALDSGSEALILDVLKNAGERKTVIAVAHRLSTIQHADVIYVLGSGRVVEQGTHRELLARKGVYFGMCEAQGLESSVLESN